MSDDKKIAKTPIIFRPFPNWTGPRKGVSCKVKSQTYRAVTLLPVPTNEKQMKELYNLTRVQFCERGTQQIAYSCDEAVKDFYNKAMSDGNCDLDKIKNPPPDALWFIEKKPTTKNTLNETGWTMAELLEHAKKNPKT